MKIVDSSRNREGAEFHSPDRLVGVASAPLPDPRPGPSLGHMERPPTHLDGPETDRR
ncbi:hypothetical protein [Corynebacterium flavescens]|uniref:hypothetical protein n=1 Tax=Corynebacterium flavescens TaxID=28028 RepID=UPI002647A7B0|nr:hypothetical protein [Corynebacterium flavescens]MDN6823274.1 hypothetical protein [Corynebacterium flavescens]